jgi:DNA-binding winged helix-turn-helix (wHTH) protein
MEEAHVHRFGHFRLDPRDERLWRGRDELVLRPKTFAVLSYLVKHAGRLVSRDELLEAVWPGIVVSEAVLTVCIGEIRQALGDDSREARYVETAHRRGYRFIATVTSSTPFVHAAEPPGPAPGRSWAARLRWATSIATWKRPGGGRARSPS